MTLTPKTRKAIYAAVGAILALLVGYNLLSADDSARWLDVADKVLAVAALALAYRKVDTVAAETTGGKVVAGPAAEDVSTASEGDAVIVEPDPRDQYDPKHRAV